MDYKVIKGEVGGNGNKIFKVGDTVTDKNFPRGNAEKLVELGYLESVKSGESASEPKEKTKKEIISELTALGAEFNQSDNKETLSKLLDSLTEDDSDEI